MDLKFQVSLLLCNVMMRMAAGKCYVEEEVEDTQVEKQLIRGFKDKFFSSLAMNICDFIPFLKMISFKGIEKSMIELHNARDEFL